MSGQNGKGRLFEYAVLYHPKPNTNGDGAEEREPSELVVDLTRVVSDSEEAVAMKAARAIPEEYEDRLDRCEVVVRGF